MDIIISLSLFSAFVCVALSLLASLYVLLLFLLANENIWSANGGRVVIKIFFHVCLPVTFTDMQTSDQHTHTHTTVVDDEINGKYVGL